MTETARMQILGYREEHDGVVVRGDRVMKSGGSSLIVLHGGLNVWRHTLLTPEQHTAHRLLRRTSKLINTTQILKDCKRDIHLQRGKMFYFASDVDFSTSASATPLRA